MHIDYCYNCKRTDDNPNFPSIGLDTVNKCQINFNRKTCSINESEELD